MIPTLALIPLCTSAAPTCSGAAYELRDTARETATVTVDGFDVEVRKGERVVVARGGTASDYESALEQASLAVNKGLDLLAIGGGNSLAIKGSEDEHIAWWEDAGQLVMRVWSLSSMMFNVHSVQVVVRDATGTIVPPDPTPAVQWHESFRYLRLSQVTDDLFDAYRNAYLALESILSDIAPQQVNSKGQVYERERQWFRRALTAAGQFVSLATFVPAGTADPVQRLFDDLFVVRSNMSHAKSGRQVLLPHVAAERTRVSASLRQAVRLYLELAEKRTGARWLSGGITHAGSRMAMLPMLEEMSANASDDESPLDKAETSAAPAGGQLIALAPASPSAELRPGVYARVWTEPTSKLAALPFIRRIVGLFGDTLVLVTVLPGRLVLGATSRLEIMMGIRIGNVREPRESYGS